MKTSSIPAFQTLFFPMLTTIWAYLVYTWGGLHRYFGNHSHIRSEHETAVYYFARAYAIAPDYEQARLARGVLLARELQRYDEALAEFNWLLARDAANGNALLNGEALLNRAFAPFLPLFTTS